MQKPLPRPVHETRYPVFLRLRLDLLIERLEPARALLSLIQGEQVGAHDVGDRDLGVDGLDHLGRRVQDLRERYVIFLDLVGEI